ncbi:acyl carrier protein [Micromonospora sp. NPDC000207]|uniref:acyl carrier protein n=1 Tax=Micromonospora sp. NPDC000207 TaxID=3154246 RepID=UPI0033263055
MGRTELRQRIAELVEEATEGGVPVGATLTGLSLVALGLDSLGLLRLVDAIEQEYDVEVEFGASGRLDTIDDLVATVADRVPDRG